MEALLHTRGNSFPPGLKLGSRLDGGGSLVFPPEAFDRNLHVLGGIGSGKSKFLESLVRQYILGWRKSRAGMILIDPHGSLYDEILKFLAWWRPADLPIIPIDLRRDESVVAYNILRQRNVSDPSPMADRVIQTLCHSSGAANSDAMPRLERWTRNFILTLQQNGLSLADAHLLLNHSSQRIRSLLVANLQSHFIKRDWELAGNLSPQAFEAMIESTVNRLQRFLSNDILKNMFSQTSASLDFGAALENGHIILVNLATAGGLISPENARLFGTMLLGDLWTAAQERGKSPHVKPFWSVIDEVQRFATVPFLGECTDESRGYKLSFVLSHQYLAQLQNAGGEGTRLHDSVVENACSKVVFRLSNEENLAPLAKWLYFSEFSGDEVKLELFSRKVMDYREETRLVRSYGKSTGSTWGHSIGRSSGWGEQSSETYHERYQRIPSSWVDGYNRSSGESSAESYAASEMQSETESEHPLLVPVFGSERSSVQFRSIPEQIQRAMRRLFMQRDREFTARLVGMTSPVTARTEDVKEFPSSPAWVRAYVKKLESRWSFILPKAEALKRIAEREAELEVNLMARTMCEAESTRRLIRCA